MSPIHLVHKGVRKFKMVYRRDEFIVLLQQQDKPVATHPGGRFGFIPNRNKEIDFQMKHTCPERNSGHKGV